MAVKAGGYTHTGEWVRATASLVLLTFGVGACGLTSGQRSTPQELSQVALAFETGVRQFFHPGFRPGPAVITTQANADGEVAIFEERRVSPFGVPIDALREEVPGEPSVESSGFFAREAFGALEKQHDHTTGYTHHVARWMAPQLGRWLTPDPLFLVDPSKSFESPGESGLYSYALNNPVNAVDPTGEIAIVLVVPVLAPVVADTIVAGAVLAAIAAVADMVTSEMSRPDEGSPPIVPPVPPGDTPNDLSDLENDNENGDNESSGSTGGNNGDDDRKAPKARRGGKKARDSGKNEPHANQKRKKAATDKYNDAVREYDAAKKRGATKKELRKLEKQKKHWQRKKDFTGDNDSMRGRGGN